MREPVSWWRRIIRPLLAIPTPVVFVVAAAVAALLLWRQGSLGEIGRSLRAANPWQALGILGVYGASIMGLALRWHTLVRMVGGTPPWGVSAEVFLTSVIVNYAAPIGLAVPTRAALTVRDLRLSPRQSGAVVGWEAGLDIAALGGISVAWLLFSGAGLLGSVAVDFRVFLAVAALLALAGIALAIGLRFTAIGRRVRAFIREGISYARQEPGFASLAVALTVGYWAVQTAVMAALLHLLGTSPVLPLLLGVMGLPILLGMLSPVPGGAGIREGLMAAAARLEGVPAGPVLLAAIAYRLALFVVTPVVWGVVRAALAVQRRQSR